ncbi:hypothetical protein [Clostridium sp. CCUG 7971]|uniref:hypothetical protein n=1 Tax=Clostridium sp. CCUG 7971 TaxID=2811414 RepID=UPI001ABBD0E7|nr:hypothetical protein [Clostridium sp. CCUG 7971]MBO3445585.1 hypothetical protein [Clostridium sp. CCUG 7971]
MSVIKNEIKKIFNITNLIIIGIVTSLIWILFINFEIEDFPKDRPQREIHKDFVYMLKKYGTEVDKEEFEDYKKIRDERIKKANDYLSSNEEYVKHGLGNYENLKSNKPKDYKEGGYSYDPKRREELKEKILFEDNTDIFWEIEATYSIIEDYEETVYIDDKNIDLFNDDQINRFLEFQNRTKPNSTISSIAHGNYSTLIESINKLIVISIFIMISPIFIKDNKNKVNYLQYSSKVGREILNKKIISGIISSILIITLQLIIFFVIYKQNNTFMFWDCNINSLFNGVHWYDMTFGQYIILTVIQTYILGIVSAIISMFVSTRVNTYISLIGIQIPILFIFYKIINRYNAGYLTAVYEPKYLLYVLYIGLVVISVLLIYMMIKREKKLHLK